MALELQVILLNLLRKYMNTAAANPSGNGSSDRLRAKMLQTRQ